MAIILPGIGHSRQWAFNFPLFLCQLLHLSLRLSVRLSGRPSLCPSVRRRLWTFHIAPSWLLLKHLYHILYKTFPRRMSSSCWLVTSLDFARAAPSLSLSFPTYLSLSLLLLFLYFRRYWPVSPSPFPAWLCVLMLCQARTNSILFYLSRFWVPASLDLRYLKFHEAGGFLL